MIFAAVIRISEFNESARCALESIVKCRHKFSQTIIVTNTIKNYGKQYECLNIVQCPSLKVDKVTSLCILEIPPHCSFVEKTIESIEKAIAKASFEHTIFHVPTIATFKLAWNKQPLYGLVLVSFVLQWLRQWWSGGTMYENDDIVARMVITRGSRRKIAKKTSYNVSKYIHDENAICAHTSVFRHFNAHLNYGLDWWVVYTAWLWICTSIFFALLMLGQIYFTTTMIGVSVMVTMLYAMVIQLFSNYYIRFAGKPIFLVLFPLYIVWFPFALFWYKHLKSK